MSPGWRKGDMRPVAYMSEAPTCTVGPSRPIEAPQRSPSGRQNDLADGDPERDQGRPAGLILDLARRDRLGNAAALGAGEKAQGEIDGDGKAQGRKQERRIGPSALDAEEAKARQIGELGEARRDQAGEKPAHQEDELAAPAG